MLVGYEVVMPHFLTSAAIVTQNLREGKTMKAGGQLSKLITTLPTIDRS